MGEVNATFRYNRALNKKHVLNELHLHKVTIVEDKFHCFKKYDYTYRSIILGKNFPAVTEHGSE